MSLPFPAEVLEATRECVDRQGRAALCHIVQTKGATPGKVGWKLLVRPDGTAFGNLGGGAFEALVREEAVRRLVERPRPGEVRRYYFTESAVRGEATGMVCGGTAEVFVEVLTARPVFVICGGGSVGQALAANASLLGYEILVADDREEFRAPSLFPAGALLPDVEQDFAAPFLEPLRDRELHVAVVSRCWDTDLAALSSVLRQAPPRLTYLGLLGGRRKIEKVKAALEKDGLSLKGVSLHAPIGLDIGAETPAEIALAILAEVLQKRRRHPDQGGEVNQTPV